MAPQLNVVSLFSGAGGLDLGLQEAGFDIIGCVERDEDCRATLRRSTHWPISPDGDVERTSAAAILATFAVATGKLSLLAGGPPCQPFSKSGRWVNGSPSGMADPRTKPFLAFFDVLEAALPETMLLENVRGLMSPPPPASGQPRAVDVIQDALARINARHGTAYAPTFMNLDAADFGVPQHRERVFVFAHREGGTLRTPLPTHGVRAGDAGEPWTTAWDALAEFDADPWDRDLAPGGRWAGLLPSIPEGSNYLFHTARGHGEPLFGWRRRYWSFLLKLAKNRPSWTIQAQPGPATGPFHWKSRLLSTDELGRLQTFPDAHHFVGTPNSVRRQIGNAVPVALGELLGLAIRSEIFGQTTRRTLRTIPRHRTDTPGPEIPAPVPEQYLQLRGSHHEHPGKGQGPGALLRTTVTSL